MEYLPKGEKYDISDLLHIMQILRSDNGCPWDKVQTHESIRMNFVEEVYEALEAIDRSDTELMREELGDVLLQVVFHARIEEEAGHFDFSDVVHDVCCKLIVRHPHIFADTKADTIPQVLSNWNDIKRQTKGQTTYTQTLESVSKALPGLMRTQKIHSRSFKAGVEAPPQDEVIRRIRQSAMALSDCTEEERSQRIGDLLFDAALLSQLCDLSAEELLERKTDAYISRFAKMEDAVSSTGKQIKDCDQNLIQHLINDEES